MSPKRVLTFQHVACEDLGTFAEVLAERDLQLQYVRLFAGDGIPRTWQDARALIFLGGPMSVNDESTIPYLAAEKALIRGALERGVPTLGVCLGAQLLAAAAGSRVFPGARPEIGWDPVSLTLEGQQDVLLSCIREQRSVFHWHGETFELPPGATRLAFSALTMNQAFRLASTAYGLQFHLEVTAALIAAWMREYSSDLEPDSEVTTRRIAEQTALHAESLRATARELMSRFLDLGTR